jgi:hypothetical protein
VSPLNILNFFCEARRSGALEAYEAFSAEA